MSKRFIAILCACVVALIAVFALTNKKAATPGSSSAGTLSQHTLGDNKKGVTLVEYGDYQCPACGAYYPLVKQVTDKYTSDIQFQFRNFPLNTIHPNARASARAAEAAGKQNKYWEMHDLLYEQQKSWESSSSAASIFEGYATQLGLDSAKYKTDFASTEVNDVINADYNEGTHLGITGTPTFFLQGKKVDNAPQTAEAFYKLIDDAIAAAQKK